MEGTWPEAGIKLGTNEHNVAKVEDACDEIFETAASHDKSTARMQQSQTVHITHFHFGVSWVRLLHSVCPSSVKNGREQTEYSYAVDGVTLGQPKSANFRGKTTRESECWGQLHKKTMTANPHAVSQTSPH